MIKYLNILTLAAILLGCGSSSGPISFSMEEKKAPSESLFIGIALTGDDQLWLSGTNSTLLRSLDGGDSWDKFQHPEIDTFQFRDIHAFDNESIVVLASGEGANSQILTFDTSEGWQTRFIMPHEEGFLNSIAFWNADRGLAYGDSFDGKPYLLKTSDGGQNWERIPGEVLPDANDGEGGFASSGSCIDVGKGGVAWVGTGAGGSARVLRGRDYGESWEVFDAPIVKGDFAGITSIHFRNSRDGLIAGGDLTNTDGFTENVAFTSDAGKTWELTSRPMTNGPFYGSDFIRYRRRDIAVACGPNGADITFDRGQSWTNLTTQNLWVADLHPSGIGWLAGRNGQIFKIILQ